MALVTLAEACAHLRIPNPGTDPDLEGKLAAAEAIILDYLNLNPEMRTTTATWDAATVPLPAKSAILLEFGELWRFRGDDAEAPTRDPETDLSPAIRGLLRRLQPLVVS